MTDRLTALLHDEAGRLDVPPPAAHAVLARGRRLRRRRSATTASVLAALALVAGGAALGATGGSDRAVELPPATTGTDAWAVGSGTTVHLGTGEAVAVQGTVKSLYYTSAGLLARTGLTSSTDEARSLYELVRPDGAVSDFELELGDRVPGTDPTLPLLAYADATDDPGRWDLVLRDVRTGAEVRRVPVEGAFTWGGWVAPPVALSGDVAYVGLDEGTVAVHWRSGTVEVSALPAATMPSVRGGLAVLTDRDGGTRVVEALSGEVVLELATTADQLADLSPDGRHLLVHGYRMCEEDDTCAFTEAGTVHDLASGRSGEVEDLAEARGHGWTPEGQLLVVRDAGVLVCEMDRCEDAPVPVDGGDVRVAGSTYEA